MNTCGLYLWNCMESNYILLNHLGIYLVRNYASVIISFSYNEQSDLRLLLREKFILSLLPLSWIQHAPLKPKIATSEELSQNDTYEIAFSASHFLLTLTCNLARSTIISFCISVIVQSSLFLWIEGFDLWIEKTTRLASSFHLDSYLLSETHPFLVAKRNSNLFHMDCLIVASNCIAVYDKYSLRWK